MTLAQQQVHHVLWDTIWRYDRHLVHKRLFDKYLTIAPSKNTPSLMHILYKGWSVGCFFKWDEVAKRQKLDTAYGLLEAIEMRGWNNE